MLHCCIATTVVLEPAICEDLDLHVAIFKMLIVWVKITETYTQFKFFIMKSYKFVLISHPGGDEEENCK